MLFCQLFCVDVLLCDYPFALLDGKARSKWDRLLNERINFEGSKLFPQIKPKLRWDIKNGGVSPPKNVPIHFENNYSFFRFNKVNISLVFVYFYIYDFVLLLCPLIA